MQSENLSFKTVNIKTESNIFNLEQNSTQGKEVKNSLKSEYDLDINKLNKNKVEEMSRMKNDETETDVGNVIENLQKELTNQSNETYCDTMICSENKKAEIISSDLETETELREELLNINVLKVSLEADLAELKNRLENKEICIEKLSKEVKNLNLCISTLEEKNQNLVTVKNNEVDLLNQEINKLNNNIIEMSQQIKYLEELAKLTHEENTKEIDMLHQQFAAETKKSENIIKNLKIELEAEKYARLKLKDDFDNRIMKLNEKVLNRNNELVELQNNIIQKSELIEVMQSDLRHEKELRDELSNACNHQLLTLNEQKNAIELDMTQKALKLQEQCQEKDIIIAKLTKDIEILRSTISSIDENGKHLDAVIKEKQKEIEFLSDKSQKEKEILNHTIDERNASIKSLQMQLQNEIEYKLKLQSELSALQTCKTSLLEEVNVAKNSSQVREQEALEWQKIKDEMNKQIQTYLHTADRLEKENEILVMEMETLKELHTRKINDHQENVSLWEKKEIKMKEQIQVNVVKIKTLEEEKSLLQYEIEALKALQRKQTKDQEAKTLAWEKHKTEINEKMQTYISELNKPEVEKAILMNETEGLNAIQLRLTEDNDENALKQMTNKMLVDENTMTSIKMETFELQRIVKQKNKEITELKRRVLKTSALENRASQLIKVSGKYQAKILKSIAEI